MVRIVQPFVGCFGFKPMCSRSDQTEASKINVRGDPRSKPSGTRRRPVMCGHHTTQMCGQMDILFDRIRRTSGHGISLP